MSSESSRPIRSIRYPDRTIEVMLNQLDNEPVDERARLKRIHKRYPYRVPAMTIRMQQPGSATAAHYVVPTRNISAGGLAFLHGGFVHIGSKVLAQPVRQDGMWSDILGRVVSCRYIERGIHEVCVKFEDQIDPSQFCAAAVSYEFLVVEDDDAIARLAEHHLGMLNVEVTRARHGREAVMLTAQNRYDCVLMDMEMPIMHGWDAVRAMREAGYSGRIVAVTALHGPEDEQKCLEVGCNDYVAKPVMPNTFRKILDGVNEEPLLSRFHEDAGMKEMLADFCDSLPAELRRLRELQENDDRPGIEAWVRAIRGSAGSYGFETLVASAEMIEGDIATSADDARLAHNIAEFMDLAKRVQGPARPKGEKAAAPRDGKAAA
jgi:CheY-like chemotaxis protein